MADFISYKGFRWEYDTFGNGEELLLAFHGFGNHSSDFKVFEPALGKKYKILSFNLPYHGQSAPDVSDPGKTVSKNDLQGFIEHVAGLHSRHKFSLMGYSLGGKIVLQLIELMPDRIQSVFLFAPDGLQLNVSNAFVTRSLLGKKIYQQIVKNPSGLFRFAGFLQKSKLLNKKMVDFIRDSMATQKKREMVWDVWMCFRDINPSIKNVQRLINEKGIRIHLFFGMYDRIIPPSIGRKFVKGIRQSDSLHVVEAGHNLVKEKVNKYLLGVLAE